MQHSIIDKLIEEALFEFTSLQENSVAGQGAPTDSGKVGAAPLSLDKFRDPHDWGRVIQIQETSGTPTSTLPAQMFEAGNLAALEESEDEALPPYDSDAPPSGLLGISTPPPPAFSPAEGDAPGHSALLPKGSSSAVAFVVFLVVLVVTAGAYYTGLLPGVTPPH